jgi:hypothetical protein
MTLRPRIVCSNETDQTVITDVEKSFVSRSLKVSTVNKLLDVAQHCKQSLDMSSRLKNFILFWKMSNMLTLDQTSGIIACLKYLEEHELKTLNFKLFKSIGLKVKKSSFDDPNAIKIESSRINLIMCKFY